MKFDVVVGNPPYQVNDNGKRKDQSVNASASPVYNLFFELSKKITKKNISLIFPARWLTGAGKGLEIFTRDMLNDKHIKKLILYKNSSEVFPNTDIKGGVVYFNYDFNYQGKTDIIIYDVEGDKREFTSYLNSENSNVFIPYQELISLYIKVMKKKDLNLNNIQNITSVRNPYGLSTDFFKNPSKYNLPKIFITRQTENDIEIIGLENSKRVLRYVPQDYPLVTGKELIDTWKVFGPYAYGSGDFGEIAPKLLIGKPNQIATETFLVFGPFISELEAISFKKYFKSKFFRALIGILKTTQHSTTTYRFVPLQDFTNQSDIDWTQSIAYIDQQLYKKYNLDENEIAFIEEKVRAME